MWWVWHFEIYGGENQLRSGQDKGFFLLWRTFVTSQQRKQAADSNKGIFEKVLKFRHTSRKKRVKSRHI